MRNSPLIALTSTPPLLHLLSPVWPIILILILFTLNYIKLMWVWIWVFGLILDSMQHNILGTHVIAMGLVMVLMSRYLNGKERFSLLQSMMMMGFACIIYLLTMMSIEGASSEFMRYVNICGQTFASILLWPWLYSWLTKPRKKYHRMI